MSMRTRFTALTVGMVVLVIAWFFIGLKPSTAKLSEVKAAVTTKRAEVATLQARLAELQALKANEEQLRADAARFAKALPTKPAVSDYIRQVQNIANEAGIDFLSLAPTPPADAAAAAAAAAPAGTAAAAAAPAPAAGTSVALKSITVSMTAKGDFFRIEDFVSKMERLDRAVRIDTFALSGASPDLSLTASLRMFMGAVTAPVAPAAAAPPSDTGSVVVPEATSGEGD